MLKGFRDFLLRGNVVDLAVAVVVGGAFGKVVDAFATDFIGSILGKIGNTDFNSVAPGGILIGSVITALINFVIVAGAIYFIVVLPMNKLSALRKAGVEEPAAATPEDVELLREIRDLLRQRV